MQCMVRKRAVHDQSDRDNSLLSKPIFGGRGCDEALFSDKKGVFGEKGGGNSVNGGFWVRISKGKAIQ